MTSYRVSIADVANLTETLNSIVAGEAPALTSYVTQVETLPDYPTVIAAGPTAADARTAIGAGTSDLELGTTATTAKAGDYQPTKADVGLGNVDNTADAAKPISTATQTALDAKAPLDSPTFTGTVSGITKADVGLANADDTADTAKPVSTAQQTALDAKLNLAGGTMTNGLSFGSQAVASAQDVSRHIALYSVDWGMCITSETMNFNAADDGSSKTKYAFYHGAVAIGYVEDGITDPKSLTTKEYVDTAAAAKLTDASAQTTRWRGIYANEAALPTGVAGDFAITLA